MAILYTFFERKVNFDENAQAWAIYSYTFSKSTFFWLSDYVWLIAPACALEDMANSNLFVYRVLQNDCQPLLWPKMANSKNLFDVVI